MPECPSPGAPGTPISGVTVPGVTVTPGTPANPGTPGTPIGGISGTPGTPVHGGGGVGTAGVVHPQVKNGRSPLVTGSALGASVVAGDSTSKNSGWLLTSQSNGRYEITSAVSGPAPRVTPDQPVRRPSRSAVR
ncbi:hypothetical protein [Kitasatospora sp. NBC_01266]|uniref:hypothetical protein n=1 Tax=Kitasatospora sp. NBC_01266 TaxID=2903572 RepID=UPI002E36B2F9|nr:hypothetical protein [Kitasatospora sp. NBC_01266]